MQFDADSVQLSATITEMIERLRRSAYDEGYCDGQCDGRDDDRQPLIENVPAHR